jgi:hypothetical protein
MTRTRPSSPIMMLSGLRSRWTSPAACAAAIPRPACIEASRISVQRPSDVREPLAQRLPGDELHDDAELRVDLERLIYSDDIRVREAGQRLGLAQRALAGQLVVARGD